MCVPSGAAQDSAAAHPDSAAPAPTAPDTTPRRAGWTVSFAALLMFAGEAGILVVPDQPWEPIEAFGYALDDLLAAAAGTRQPALDARFGAEITAILAAATQSAATGRTITL